MQTTDGIEVYNVSLLRHGDRYLLLQRSLNKQFAPGRWTGLGGHVEAHEFNSLRAAALREVNEEAGLLPDDILDYAFRRAVLVSRPHQPLGILLYYTGVLAQFVTPDCPEGTLYWKEEDEFAGLDIVETTRAVFALLLRDMETDPQGLRLPETGLSVFSATGEFRQVIWGQRDEGAD